MVMSFPSSRILLVEGAFMRRYVWIVWRQVARVLPQEKEKVEPNVFHAQI
jgi:hypothetical protein